MTRYLLDTDVLIDFSKGIEPVTTRLQARIRGTDTVAICAISVAEFFAGLTPGQAIKAETFIFSLEYWAISLDAAKHAGQNRYMFARAGTTITTTDTLLAAVAREYEATLVTSNLKYFPIEDLVLVSVR